MHVCGCWQASHRVAITLLIFGTLMFVIKGTSHHRKPYSSPFDRKMKEIKANQYNIDKLQQEFINALIDVASTLPKKKLCMTVLRYITDQNHPLIAKIVGRGYQQSRKISCEKFKEKNKDLPKTQASKTIQLLVILYNQLPLPFQCHVLTTATFEYFDKRRYRDKNKKYRRGTNLISDEEEKNIYEPSLMQKSQTFIDSIQQAEKALLGHRILPVAKQCERLAHRQNAYSKSIYITVQKTKNTADLRVVDTTLRANVPKIVEDYAKRNGIKIGLSLIDRHWVRTLQSLVFISIKENKSTLTYFGFKCKLFLALGNTGPISGNLVLAALNDYGKVKFFNRTGLNMDFSLLLDDKPSRLNDESNFQQDLFMKQVFPGYLEKYFKMLPASNQEYLIDTVSIYSGQQRRKIINMLQLERGLSLSVFLQKSKRRIKTQSRSSTTKYKTHRSTKMRKLSNNTKVTTVTKLTNIEIIMIAALSCLAIFGFVFVSTFVLFQRRRKEFNQKVIEIQKLAYKDTPSMLYHNKGSNSSVQSNSTQETEQTDTDLSRRNSETFFKRSKRYCEQNGVNILVRTSSGTTMHEEEERFL